MTTTLDRFAFTPKEVSEATGIAFTRVKEAIASGELVSIESSPKRRICRREHVIAWLDYLEKRSA